MTEIEELASRLGYYIESDDIGSGDDLLNSLVIAAEKEFERGKVEGAEQWAAKIVHCGECTSAKPYPDEPMVECRFGCDRPIDGFCSLGTILTPTKEKP